MSKQPEVEDQLHREQHEFSEAVRLERHNSIEPVPEEDKDSKPLHQFWIWAGANIAPINWVLGTRASRAGTWSMRPGWRLP